MDDGRGGIAPASPFHRAALRVWARFLARSVAVHLTLPPAI